MPDIKETAASARADALKAIITANTGLFDQIEGELANGRYDEATGKFYADEGERGPADDTPGPEFFQGGAEGLKDDFVRYFHSRIRESGGLTIP